MSTPKTWAPHVRPTPEQLAVWLQDATHEERVKFAEHALEASDKAMACFIRDHEGHLRTSRGREAQAWFDGYEKGNLDGYFGTSDERAKSPYADLDPYREEA